MYVAYQVMAYSCSSGMMIRKFVRKINEQVIFTGFNPQRAEIDSFLGCFGEDYEQGQLIRSQTVDFMRSCLDPSPTHSRDKSPSQITSAFDSFGITIGNAYDVGKYLFTHRVFFALVVATD